MSESLSKEENRITIMVCVIIECLSHHVSTRHYAKPKVLFLFAPIYFKLAAKKWKW